MTVLPDGRKSFKISLAVLIQSRRAIVTDRHPATQPPSQPCSQVAVAHIALYATRRAGKSV